MSLIGTGLLLYTLGQVAIAQGIKATLPDPPITYNIHHCAASLDSDEDEFISVRNRPRIDTTLTPYFILRDGVKYVGFLAFENNELRFIEVEKLKQGEKLPDTDGTETRSFRFKNINGMESVIEYSVKHGEIKPKNARLFGNQKFQLSIPLLDSKPFENKKAEYEAREAISAQLNRRLNKISTHLTEETFGKPLAADAVNQKGGGYRKYLQTLLGIQKSGHQGCRLFLVNYLRHNESLSPEDAHRKVDKLHADVMAAISVGPSDDSGPTDPPAFTPINNQTTTAELLE